MAADDIHREQPWQALAGYRQAVPGYGLPDFSSMKEKEPARRPALRARRLPGSALAPVNHRTSCGMPTTRIAAKRFPGCLFEGYSTSLGGNPPVSIAASSV